mmetsp:Transcript_9273/g.15885  ORF Transcript_9273/g.15885 Transcript_9273/m.15885 type:complete len:207 (+) Transcript_9273:354-974(+)
MHPLVGRLPRGELDASDAVRPDIRLVIVAVSLLQDLWCHPAGRSDEGLPFLVVPQWCGNTEVRQENSGIQAQKDIPSFEISMNLHVVVKILHGLRDLTQDVCNDAFIFEAHRTLCGSHHIGAGAALQQRHHQPHLPLGWKGNVVGDHVLMTTHLHHLQLSPNFFQTRVCKLLQLNDLHCHVRVGLRARHHFGLVDGSKGAVPDAAQ